ncbi:MAG: hypothetical protein QOE35_885 [Actinomycetota bacterium]|jgi:hypothetical protein
MAVMRIDGDDLVVELTGWEKAGALRGDVRVPRRSVREVRLVDDAMAAVKGLRAPGTGWPGVIALGTWRRRGAKDFVAAYRHRPGVVVELDGAPFARLIVSTDDPAAVVEALQRSADGAAGGTGI